MPLFQHYIIIKEALGVSLKLSGNKEVAINQIFKEMGGSITIIQAKELLTSHMSHLSAFKRSLTKGRTGSMTAY